MEFEPIDVIILVAGFTLMLALGFAIVFWFQDKKEEKAKPR